MKQKITKRTVDAMTAASSPQFMWDTLIKGFGLKITPTGRKIYVLQYRLPGRPTRRYTIGAHGSPWTPEAARTKATQLLGEVAQGRDPADAKKAAKAELTVSQLCDAYLVDGVRTKKMSTADGDRSRIENHIRPILGSKRLSALAASDINRFMADVAAGKTSTIRRTRPRGRSVVRGGKSAANRALATLSAILAFGVESGLGAHNPVGSVKKYKENRRTRFLSNDEIARLGDALRQAELNGINSFATAAIRLLLLTGCRKNEILALRWDEVDIEGGFLRLRDSKTGAKPVPLGAPALAILANLSRIADNPHVIVGEKSGGHFVGLQKVWAKVRERADLGDVRLHDLRHSFASVGARSGESLLVIGKVLGHANSSSTSRYAHLSEDPMRTAADAIGRQIEAQLSEGAERHAGEGNVGRLDHTAPDRLAGSRRRRHSD